MALTLQHPSCNLAVLGHLIQRPPALFDNLERQYSEPNFQLLMNPLWHMVLGGLKAVMQPPYCWLSLGWTVPLTNPASLAANRAATMCVGGGG